MSSDFRPEPQDGFSSADFELHQLQQELEGEGDVQESEDDFSNI